MSQCVEQLSGGGENNVYNELVAKVINRELTPENDQLTLDLCNKVKDEGSDPARSVVLSILKWISHNKLNALSLVDALSKNCGGTANREIASLKRYALSSISRWRKKWADEEGLPTMKDCFNTLEADYYWTGSNFLSFKDIFQSKGYELWNNTGLARAFVPPNTNPRAPDGFSYDDPSGAACKPYFSAAVEKHWPARTPDNQDVLLVLIKDPVELAILRDVAMGTKGGIDRNHVLPLLRIIEHEKLTFGVFPLIGMSLLHPWFANLNQMLDAIYQILEVWCFFTITLLLTGYENLHVRKVFEN
ncbi:uncharacterized protein C8R40DRAFT_1075254 [Lentinula edodes]|uniref:uncharacterized protein n=1 Tax=Lentinula edodes TaxID=5353 RepID=UPI001E8DC5A4|nr:uncharacterized protein C8R40DRAFT_1075254 [Lentinula edodes]KAH7867899.1 hypothetical protein C8R40DRAFT_1075254 [Lentinula edodes]